MSPQGHKDQFVDVQKSVTSQLPPSTDGQVLYSVSNLNIFVLLEIVFALCISTNIFHRIRHGLAGFFKNTSITERESCWERVPMVMFMKSISHQETFLMKPQWL